MKNNKSLGQHWLKNRTILDEIARLAATSTSLSSDAGAGADALNGNKNRLPTTCLEIGPGLGTLTSSLLKRFNQVIAVEFDENLAKNLPNSFPGKNLKVIHGDILDTNIPALVGTESYVVVGNIPYYITSPIIRQLLNLSPAPHRIVLLIQKEVAQRLAAEQGSHSFLSLLAQNRATVTLGPIVRAAEFTPPPKVDSQILILDPLAAPQISDQIFPLIRQGFSNPRKKLSANLAGHPFSKTAWEEILRRAEINPNARAEDLSLWDWKKLESLRQAPPENP